MNGFVTAIGWLCGALFLLLAIFVTIDVVSRRLGGPFTAVTDDISAYVLALGGTWALSYALLADAHVRIDVIFHLFPQRMREFLRLWGIAVAGAFGLMLAWHAWKLVAESYEFDAHVNSILPIPLYLPQSITAMGISLFVLQAAAMLVCGSARFFGSGSPPPNDDAAHQHVSI